MIINRQIISSSVKKKGTRRANHNNNNQQKHQPVLPKSSDILKKINVRTIKQKHFAFIRDQHNIFNKYPLFT